MAWWTYRTVKRNEDWQSEASLYASLVRQKPNNPTGWNGLGTVLEKQKNPAKARECYLRALALNGSMASAVYNLGASYFYEGDYSNAKMWFLKNVGATTLQAETFTFLGLIEMKKNHNESALEYFTKAEKINPLDPMARTDKEILLQRMGRTP